MVTGEKLARFVDSKLTQAAHRNEHGGGNLQEPCTNITIVCGDRFCNEFARRGIRMLDLAAENRPLLRLASESRDPESAKGPVDRFESFFIDMNYQW